MEKENYQPETEGTILEPKEKQRKRSKRHRRNRNNISDKARVEAVKEFGIHSREVHRQYLAKHRKQELTTIYAK